jgi:hypothetical protein
MRLLAAALLAAAVMSSQEMTPRVVLPAAPGAPPSDAIVLFDGASTAAFTRRDGSPTGCKPLQGEMVCATGAGHAVSRETFEDAQIHVEFNVPHMPAQQGQHRGNSGVFLGGCFEVQVLDSFENPTYANGMLGSIYGFSPPIVNAGRKPGEWQSYDIIYRAPRCDASGKITKPGSATILLNGVLVNENVKLDKRGGGCVKPTACGPGTLLLQDHSGFKNAPHTEMRFRNIWLRKLD